MVGRSFEEISDELLRRKIEIEWLRLSVLRPGRLQALVWFSREISPRQEGKAVQHRHRDTDYVNINEDWKASFSPPFKKISLLREKTKTFLFIVGFSSLHLAISLLELLYCYDSEKIEFRPHVWIWDELEALPECVWVSVRSRREKEEKNEWEQISL